MPEDNKQNILHLIQTLQIGGAEVLLTHYIKALGFENYNHYVYFFGNAGPIKKKLEEYGAEVNRGKNMKVIKHPLKFIKSFYWLLRDLIAFIKAKNIQFIVSHLGPANQLGVVAGKLARIPSFPTVHNTMAFIDNRRRTNYRIYIIKIVDHIVYRIADKILAISDEVKEIITNQFKLRSSRIIVLKNGIVFNSNYANRFDSAAETDLGIEKKFKIISVGSLTYQKAMDVLIKGVTELKKAGILNLTALIVGDGDERASLDNLIKKSNMEREIKLLGTRDDVFELMKNCDCFVMTSRYEGLSIAMIEAMACKMPIVASNAPGINRYITNEWNGLLFPVEDHKALAKQIERVMKSKSLSDKLSKNAIRTFKDKFDMNRNIKTLEDLFFRYPAE